MCVTVVDPAIKKPAKIKEEEEELSWICRQRNAARSIQQGMSSVGKQEFVALTLFRFRRFSTKNYEEVNAYRRDVWDAVYGYDPEEE